MTSISGAIFMHEFYREKQEDFSLEHLSVKYEVNNMEFLG